VDQYRVQGRGGLGIKVAKLTEERGDLVGAMIVSETDEALIVMERGKVVRSSVAGVPAKGRDTMGVVFAKPDKNDRIIAVAKNEESAELEDDELAAEDATPSELSAESDTVGETPEAGASDQAESAESDEADGTAVADDAEDV
jgi:DNA gyrase subunit A